MSGRIQTTVMSYVSHAFDDYENLDMKTARIVVLSPAVHSHVAFLLLGLSSFATKFDSFLVCNSFTTWISCLIVFPSMMDISIKAWFLLYLYYLVWEVCEFVVGVNVGPAKGLGRYCGVGWFRCLVVLVDLN